MSYNLQAQMII